MTQIDILMLAFFSAYLQHYPCKLLGHTLYLRNRLRLRCWQSPPKENLSKIKSGKLLLSGSKSHRKKRYFFWTLDCTYCATEYAATKNMAATSREARRVHRVIMVTREASSWSFTLRPLNNLKMGQSGCGPLFKGPTWWQGTLYNIPMTQQNLELYLNHLVLANCVWVEVSYAITKKCMKRWRMNEKIEIKNEFCKSSWARPWAAQPVQ